MADNIESSEVQHNQPLSDEQKQRIFDERFQALTDGFGKACAEHNIPIAIAIAVHPGEKHPIVFVRGHQYDVAAVLANVLRRLKQELLEDLITDHEIDYQN